MEPLFYFIYVNDLTDGLQRNVKLFADDTSIITVVLDHPNAAADNMNHYLQLISLWELKCRMPFTPDLTKQAVGVIFSRKISPSIYSPICFKSICRGFHGSALCLALSVAHLIYFVFAYFLIV